MNKLLPFILLIVNIAIIILIIIAFALAFGKNANPSTLGIIIVWLLIVTPISAVLNWFSRKLNPVKQEQKHDDYFLSELKKAPLELTAREYVYNKNIEEHKKEVQKFHMK